jgi:uncharacterized protein YhaN
MEQEIVSSAASRKHQRNRRSAHDKLDRAENALADRQVDLVAYERVLADLTKYYREGLLSPFSGAQVLNVVEIFRNVARTDCAKLQEQVAELAKAYEKLKPPSTSDPRTTLGT